MSWTVTGVSVAPGLLDTYSGAAAAYSLRRLSANYSGPVVRVRRSSDNTEQDFTAAQVTDGTLTTFCGASDGFVRTWHDQSGFNNHAQQATNANQPKIVSSGVLVTDGTGARAAISFGGSPQFMQATSVVISQPLSAVIALKIISGDSHYYDGATSRCSAYGYPNHGIFAGTATTSYSLPSSKNIFSSLFSGSNSLSRVNGVQRISGNSGLNSLSSLLIARHTSSLNFQVGNFHELIFWPSDQSSSFSAIETNINTYYAIY